MSFASNKNQLDLFIELFTNPGCWFWVGICITSIFFHRLWLFCIFQLCPLMNRYHWTFSVFPGSSFYPGVRFLLLWDCEDTGLFFLFSHPGPLCRGRRWSPPHVYARVSMYDVLVPSARSPRCRPAPSPHTLPSLLAPVPSRAVSTGAVPFWALCPLTGLCFFLPQLHFPYIFISVCPLPCWCFSKLSCLFSAPFSFIF